MMKQKEIVYNFSDEIFQITDLDMYMKYMQRLVLQNIRQITNITGKLRYGSV